LEDSKLDDKSSQAKGRRKASREHPEQRQAQWEEEKTRRERHAAGRKDTPATAADVSAASEETNVSGEAEAKSGFPVIGIGASAGGLQALESFFANVPEESGLAYVVISHTDPDRASMLPEILKRKAKIPVNVIAEGMPAEPDKVYLPPSDKDLGIEKRAFRLKERQRRDGLHMPIDMFLRSLAEDCAARAGCVILSGTGTDGSQGVRAIKEMAGVTVAQSTASARHQGMPRSAIETGLVDFILSPEEIPGELTRYFKHPGAIAAQKGQDEPDVLRRILTFLNNRTQHDFSLYKKSTLIRRIERRMGITRSKNGSEYLSFLHRNPREVETVFQDLLIGVTNFFRDPGAFVFLKNNILPDLLACSEGALKIWVPGCSTGEEAYSVAITVKEALVARNENRRFQIFATDLDKQAIEKARHGVYVENIAADVSAERLKRFFNKTNHLYQVNKEIRESIVFAAQNILSEPPFSHLDLLVCRNLLIYLQPEAQKKLIPLFHYTLNAGGILFLGTSESVGRFNGLFETLNKKYSFYRKRETKTGPLVEFPTRGGRLIGLQEDHEAERSEGTLIAQAAERLLLSDYTPTCVIINGEGQLLHVHGHTGKYLEQPSGKPSFDIIAMAREGLRFALASALREAKSSGKEVCRKRLRVNTNGSFQEFDLIVKPLSEPVALKNTVLVIFEEVESPPEKASAKREGDDCQNQHVIELERELSQVRQQYQGSLEELETSNEELRSVNEEIHSSNEELQSTNEELESSREELQSLNEELSTVNAELHSKIEELAESYDSITRVLNSTHIAILFLNNDLSVKRFTDEAARLINLIDADAGRPIEHISHNLKCPDFIEKLRKVHETLVPVEDDVQTKGGHWYRMRIGASRATESAIEGLVLTLVNIDAQKSADRKN
jgi:two-component system, chemotaxis family, CheB/CheR fusion protein